MSRITRVLLSITALAIIGGCILVGGGLQVEAKKINSYVDLIDPKTEKQREKDMEQLIKNDSQKATASAVNDDDSYPGDGIDDSIEAQKSMRNI